MCRLLGIYGAADVWQEITMQFRYLAQTGKIPPEKNLEPGHKAGWGMAVSNRKKTAMLPLVRQLGCALDASCYPEALSSTDGIPHIFLCHLRKASTGIPVTLSNTHPFFHNGWAFTHNGTIYGAEALPRSPQLILTGDDSDSEYLFHYLLSQIDRDRHTPRDVHEILAEAVCGLTLGYTAVNSMLSNGRELYVIRSFKQYEDYYNLYWYRLATTVIICSEPLEFPHLDPTQWKPMAADSILKISGSPPVVEEFPLPSR